MVDELYKIKEKLMKEIKEVGAKEISTSSLDQLDKLTHTTKNLCKIIKMCEEEEGGYSQRGRYNLGMTGSYGMMPNYARTGGNPSGNSYRRGRYSRSNEMISDLYDLMDSAPDEETRMEFDRFIRKMENM